MDAWRDAWMQGGANGVQGVAGGVHACGCVVFVAVQLSGVIA